MEEQRNDAPRPVNPRRRRRTKMQIFKEAYLPVLIAAVAVILIIVFIVGAISRSNQKNKQNKADEDTTASSIAAETARLEAEMRDLIARSEEIAKTYDYQAAIDLLNTFSGDISLFPTLNNKILEYEAAQKNLVAWDDPAKVVNLSFQLLIADPARAFTNQEWGNNLNRNFVTTQEFSKLLQQLYENGYILVDFDDILTVESTAGGTPVYTAKTLYLPKGKKPLILTQTNVNYNNYLIDSDGDKKPDAMGCGIASKLLWDGQNFTCEMVDASGNTVTGDYDLVPILEKFITSHPSFSYQGARAVLALTGYNGLFGHRTQTAAFGEDARLKAVADAKAVAEALRNRGYKLAFYTYENISYKDSTFNQFQNDLNKWIQEAVPILGKLDIMVFAQLDDLAGQGSYTGDKFNTLQNEGFRYYIGFCEDGKPWANVLRDYFRQGRIMVTGSNLAHHSDWFTALFDPSSILDVTRGTIPK